MSIGVNVYYLLYVFMSRFLSFFFSDGLVEFFLTLFLLFVVLLQIGEHRDEYKTVFFSSDPVVFLQPPAVRRSVMAWHAFFSAAPLPHSSSLPPRTQFGRRGRSAPDIFQPGPISHCGAPAC